MNSTLSSSFLSYIGKGIASIIIMLLIIASVLTVAFFLKKGNPVTPATPHIGTPEYKPGKTLSTAKIEELKINNEKLENFICSLTAICNQYHSK